LRSDGADAGHIEGHMAADRDGVPAFSHEAALRNVAHGHLDAVPLMTQLRRSADRTTVGAAWNEISAILGGHLRVS
jgi:hypothetical protein